MPRATVAMSSLVLVSRIATIQYDTIKKPDMTGPGDQSHDTFI
jgi:hypothetical protein